MIKNCSKHGDYEVEFVKLGKDNSIELACPLCIKESEEQEQQKEAEEQKQYEAKKLEQFMKARNIPKRYWNKRLKDFITDDKKMIHEIAAYIKNQDEVEKTGRSIIIYGKPGTGKTHIGCSILKNWKNKAMYINARAYTRLIKDTYNTNQSETSVINKYISYDLLLIDEVGKQSNTDNERFAMFNILNERYNDNKPTIIITNLSVNDLSDFIGTEAVDRMKENGGLRFFFDGESHR